MSFSAQEHIRFDILVKYIQGNLKLQDAIAAFGVKERQFRRYVKRFRESGPVGAVHGNRKREPINKCSNALMARIAELFQTKYYDFNVRHFHQMLIENKELDYVPSYSTIRKMLLNGNLIERSNKRIRKSYARRKRYTREGLMLQIDGSHHHWLVGHEPFCLTAAIDDATGKLLGGKFTPTETTFAAMDVVESVIRKHGLFQMLYSDKAGIYGGSKRVGYTNMDRALKELGIISIQANSPQAKGRVERLFSTLQSRLVAEMRFNGIRTIEQANQFLQQVFIDKFNEKFAVEAVDPNPAFEKINSVHLLNEIFTMREYRVVQNGNVINYGSKSYVIENIENLAKKQVEIKLYRNGDTKFWIDGKEISCRILNESKSAA